MNTKMKTGLSALVASLAAMMLSACGGGGHKPNPAVLYYPYENVYGSVCSTMEPTPGCTFSRSTGLRVTVSEDPDYNKYGTGSDDMWYVSFDSNGTATVRNDLNVFQYFSDVSDFAGWVGGNSIGVGTTGQYWEDIRNGTYWLGRNGVLYSANFLETNYGQAINNQNAGQASDTNFAALNFDAAKSLVKKGADKLIKNYGFKKDKATAIASALYSWEVSAVERGKTSGKDINKGFKATFGVQYSDALAAVKALAAGDKTSMQSLTNRSAAALGLKPSDTQRFMKDMYSKALADWGYDASSIQW